MADKPLTNDTDVVVLRSSCNSCRARKTKCDGKHPCGPCVAKFQRDHQNGAYDDAVKSSEEVGCAYSPAKRRGPQRRSGSAHVDVQRKARQPAFSGNTGAASPPNLARSITKHRHLLDPSSAEGNTLRSHFHMAVSSLIGIAELPSMSPMTVPFAVLAVGALVMGSNSLALELCNAAVHCLRESEESFTESLDDTWDKARAYFYLGVFRSMRGDMTRYFQYRRIALTYAAQAEEEGDPFLLLGAVSYLDAWAFLIHNANNEGILGLERSSLNTELLEVHSDVKMDAATMALDQANSSWMHGEPLIFLTNEAPINSRVLDALASVFRACCDKAIGRFHDLAGPSEGSRSTTQASASAVMANENDQCSRNIVLSVDAMLRQSPNEGQHIVLSTLQAFFEAGEDFSDKQIHALLKVANQLIESPLLLYHPGPTYHIASQVAILLAHIYNYLESNTMVDPPCTPHDEPNDGTARDLVLDTYTALRHVLTLHRRKLPPSLRCHGLPRAIGTKIDVGETVLCSCLACCELFVLSACSPCVAAERAAAAAARRAEQQATDEDAFLDDDLLSFLGEGLYDAQEDDILLDIMNEPVQWDV